MKLVYIYLNDLEKNNANVNQTLNMVVALSKICDTTLISGWISKPKFSERLNFFSLKKSFLHRRIPIKLNVESFFLEKITRLIYSFFVLLHLKIVKYDTIYTRDVSFLLFISYLPTFLKPKQKILFEQHTIYHKSSDKIDFKYEKRALNQADFIIPISNGIKKELTELFHIPEKNMFVSPDGVNLMNFINIKPSNDFLIKKYPKSKGKKVVVYVGSFKEWKGVDTFVKSLKFIKSKKIAFLIVGGNKEERVRLNQFILKNKIPRNKLILESFLSQVEIIKILKSSDIAIIPNNKSPIGEKYTSPLKVFEYMACGLPIISSDLPSMKEILNEGYNCLFFEPENEKDLAKKIDFLSRNSILMDKFKQNNLNGCKKYSWDIRASRIINLFYKS